MAKELWITSKFILIYVLFLVVAQKSHAQKSVNSEPKNTIQLSSEMYNSVMQNLCTDSFFWGVFDSTDSYLCVRLCDWNQSPFDSSAFYCYGKSLHKNQLVNNTAYLDVNSIENVQFTITNDSLDVDLKISPFWDSIQSKGGYLMLLNAEFFIQENIKTPYSGEFSGLLSYYFIYYPNTNTIIKAPIDWLPNSSPSVIFQGFWKQYNSEQGKSISFYWGNIAPTAKRNDTYLLPDLRFRSDGSTSVSNYAEFSKEVPMPNPNWYK